MKMQDALAEELRLGQELARIGGWTPDWTIHLANRLVDIGDFAGANELLDSWIGKGWDKGDQEWAVQLLQGEIALAKGDLSQAVASIELANQLDYGSGITLEALGRAYHANGQYQESEAAFLEVINLMNLGYEPQESWVLTHYRLALLYEEMGEGKKSLDYLERFLELWGSGDEGLEGVEDARLRLQETN